jgi:hypothetical protein
MVVSIPLHNSFFCDTKFALKCTCVPVAQIDKALDFETLKTILK